MSKQLSLITELTSTGRQGERRVRLRRHLAHFPDDWGYGRVSKSAASGMTSKPRNLQQAEWCQKPERWNRACFLLWLLGMGLVLAGRVLHAEPALPPIETPGYGNLRHWNPRQTPIVEAVKRVRDAVVN